MSRRSDGPLRRTDTAGSSVNRRKLGYQSTDFRQRHTAGLHLQAMTGELRYCCTAPPIDSVVRVVRRTSFSRYRLSSRTDTPPESSFSVISGSDPTQEACAMPTLRWTGSY